jgi:hypothetical protein
MENKVEIKNEDTNTNNNIDNNKIAKTNPPLEKEKEKEENTITEEIPLETNENKNIIKKDENNKELENVSNNNEKKQEVIITKYSSLSPDLFSLSYISEFKCFLCGLIPNPENSKEIICCELLLCEECIKKIIDEKKGCPKCKLAEIKNRKIKDENKLLYKFFKNLSIKCPYKCDWKNSWSELDNHLNECKFSFRYCKYKSVGCKFVDGNTKVIEHEKNENKYHLELALKYIKDNKIEKKKLTFELGDIVRVTCHPHEMKFMHSLSWTCDGRKLPSGCYSINYSFNRDVARYRCRMCDFDLCDKCIVHYVI